MPNLLSSSDNEEEANPLNESLKINESYAKRLEHNKAREELHRLQEKYGSLSASDRDTGDEDEESSSSESEDEVGELLTPQLDSEIWRTIAMIRERRSELYDESWKGFGEELEPVQRERKEKPMYLKDYHRRNLLEGSDDGETHEQVTTYEQEQMALKEAFHTSLPQPDDEDDLIRPKKKSKEQESKEEQEYQAMLERTLQDETSRKMLHDLQSLASKAKPEGSSIETEDGDAFLAKYLLHRGWLDSSGPMPELYEDETSEDEKVDEFESQYNFRFEQPGGTVLTTHARTLSTARQEDRKRKRERERKRTTKEEQKKKEIEEIARLRNLKRMELEERINRIEAVAGAGGWSEKDLDGDFDPDEWDKRMKSVFNETYYEEEDRKKPKFDDIDISDLISEEDGVEPTIVEKTPSKREKLEKKRKIEDYLDEHFPLNQPKSAFRYREVSPQAFGLTDLEILTSSDALLNEFVGLKKLAPYRSRIAKDADMRKYGKKKRLREWRKKIKEAGEDEQIRAMFRKEKQKSRVKESQSKS